MDRHYAVPTNLNREPFLTVWWMEDPKDTICYIQVSEDIQNPVWMKFGDVFEYLAKRVSDVEQTLLADMLIAIKCDEGISQIIKKHIIR